MDKKESIISAARSLFLKYSFDKVSMDEIAKKAGVTKKTIYHYFKGKQDLFQYFVLEELETIKHKFESIYNKDESFIEKVNESLNDVLSIHDGNKLLGNLIDEKKSENFHNKGFFYMYENKIISYIESKIKEEIINGNIKKCNAHLTAFVIYKTIFSLTFEYDKSVDNKKTLEEVTDILTEGLLIKGGIRDEK